MMGVLRKYASLLLSAVLLLALCAQAGAEKAPAASREVADASQMTTVEDVVEDGMVPIAGEVLLDGDYTVAADCSSSMFRIVEAVLHASDGKLEEKLANQDFTKTPLPLILLPMRTGLRIPKWLGYSLYPLHLILLILLRLMNGSTFAMLTRGF